jgi:DNA-binding transcriptional regulator LsrR (DeoR family)
MPDGDARGPSSTAWRYPRALMYAAARLYYLEDATQAEVAESLGTSRATASRLLSEARRAGIVQIEVVAPVDQDLDELARSVEHSLGLRRVYLTASPTRGPVGAALAPALADALEAADLAPGDVLLVSSGRTVYEAAQAPLPPLPGVVLVPTIGGHEEPEPWYATNEITRQIANQIGGTPTFLYAPALPARKLYSSLLADAGFHRVLDMWKTARCAIMGVGAPPLTRTSLPRFVPREAASLQQAVGDVCSRFYDADGEPVDFPGSERLVATALDVVREIPSVIGVAAGTVKVPAIRAAAKAGYIDELVTDTETAAALIGGAANDARAVRARRPDRPAG